MKNMCAPFQEPQIKKILWMLLNSVHQCHSNNIMHRDIKPSNIMFDSDGNLKLIDFGLARVAEVDDSFPERVLSKEIATRWYKAPEVLLGSKSYDKSIDIWAVGCIFAELLGMKTFFKGFNDIEQIVMIIKTLGTPDDVSWSEFKELPDYPKLIFPDSKGAKLSDIFQDYPETTGQFLEQFLKLNPKSRITADEALDHPYFHETLPLPIEDTTLLPLFEKEYIEEDEQD